jgi:Rad3-related DNA helicase
VEYLEQVSKIIFNIADQVKNEVGTFVFVPSYSFLYKLEKRIKDAVIESKEGGMIDLK